LKELEFYQYSRKLLKENIIQEEKNIVFQKIVLEKSRVATYEFTTPINVLLNASKVLKSSDKKKRSKTTSCLVWLSR
jgi:hypothetical protein